MKIEDNKNLQLIYRQEKPYGIKDNNKFILYFPQVIKYEGQEQKYFEEVRKLDILAYKIWSFSRCCGYIAER